MTPWLDVVAAIAGVVVLASVSLDVYRTVVMPRPFYGLSLSKRFVRLVWRLWRRLGVRIRNPQRREGVLGAYAQLALLVLLTYWVLGLVLGYALILYALRDGLAPQPVIFGTALYMAGVSLLTLGIGDVVPTSVAARILTLITAASGPALIGVVLALLFSLSASFQRREALITTLDASAGAPPSGVHMLETYALLQMPDQLPQTFRAWEQWTAEVLDSHLSYPLLCFFRSTHDHESWISALGAVLDAATLAVSSIDAPSGNARLLYDIGCHAVEDLSNYFDLHHDHEVGVEPAEFAAALDTLAAAGYTVARDASWDRFAALRSRYAGPLNALAANFATPPALWVGDRATLHGARQE